MFDSLGLALGSLPVAIAASRAATLDPSTLTGYDADYDFNDLSTLFQNSAGSTAVSAINDPIGRINSKAGTSAPYFSSANDSHRPRLTTVSGGSGYGGLFDAVDDRLVCSSSSYFDYLHQTTGFTMVYALAFTDSDSASVQTLWSSCNDNAETGVMLGLQESGAAQGAFYGWVGPNKVNVFGSQGNNSHGTTLTSYVAAWQSGYTGNDFIARLGGVQIASLDTTGSPSVSGSTNTPTLGARPTGGVLLKATIRRLIIYRGRLSDTDIQRLESWIAGL